jgi:molybdate transport system substrate-binding protein
MNRQLQRLLLVAILVGCVPHASHAQTEITLIAPGGARAPFTELLPAFERMTGYKVKATYGSGQVTRKQVIQGEAFDVPVVQAPLGEIIASGNVVAASETPLANVAVGVAVKKGAPKPDIATPDAVKKMLLAAKSVSFPEPPAGATAGISFAETLRKIGIAGEMQPKLKLGQGGAGAMALVAKGEVEIGLTFMSEMEDPGIDVVGPLPREISQPTVLVGYVSSHAKDPAAAKALLEFLSSPEAASVYKAQRMQPGR